MWCREVLRKVCHRGSPDQVKAQPPQLIQPQCPNTQSQPCIRSERNTTNGMDRYHIEPLWSHGPHMLQQAPYLGQSSHSMEPYQTWPSGLQIQQLKPHLTSCIDFKSPNTNHTPYQGDNAQHTVKKDRARIQTKRALRFQTRWQSRTWAQLLSWKHQNHN